MASSSTTRKALPDTTSVGCSFPAFFIETGNTFSCLARYEAFHAEIVKYNSIAGIVATRHMVDGQLPLQSDNVVVLRPMRPVSERSRLLQTIRSFYELSADWDGEGAVKPSHAAINNADYFFQNLEDGLQALPKISLAGDGEISLAWQTDNLHLDIGFEGDDTYYYYAESAAGKVFREPKRDVRLPLPREIVGLLIK